MTPSFRRLEARATARAAFGASVLIGTGALFDVLLSPAFGRDPPVGIFPQVVADLFRHRENAGNVSPFGCVAPQALRGQAFWKV